MERIHQVEGDREELLLDLDETARAGAVEVRAPRVNDKRVDENGKPRRFKSVILPP